MMDHNNSCFAPPSAPPSTTRLDPGCPMACYSSKRPREHEEYTGCNEGGFRETKKHRPLPLRSSPRSNRRLKIVGTSEPTYFPALTPIDSSEDENMFSKRYCTESNSINPQQKPQEPCGPGMDLDIAMDMDTCEDADMYGGNTSPLTACFTPQFLTTPYDITCQQVNAGTITTIIPSALAQTTNASETMDGARDALCPPSHPPLRTKTWRSPRLPSPVSDNGDTHDKDSSGDTEMAEDTPSQQPPSLNSASVEAEAAAMRKRLSSLDLPDQGTADATPSAKPVKKLAFSMGYRADCDKCRRRVPGHYSHITRG
ncbi:hypothetical protein BJX64DRAFT_257726 [Aspergillus heterothallicus]